MLDQYRYDISKYAASARRPIIQTIFDNVPSQLAKENKRFMLRSVRRGATYNVASNTPNQFAVPKATFGRVNASPATHP